jgi:hypothetical protein
LAEACTARDCFVPEECDWCAEEDGADDGPAGPGEDEGHKAEAQDAKQVVWKDAQVLQENRELGQEQREVVDDD